MAERNGLLVGIDGGGSTCRAAVRAGAETRHFTAGPANVTSDFEGAIGTIAELVARAAGAAPIRALHLGLAGVTGRAMAERVEGALAARFPGPVIRATGDQVTTLAGALGARAGAVAGIGTGSFVIRQSPAGIRHVGGRGLVLGDQASGAWLGLRLMQEVALIHDRLRFATGLGRAVSARHGDDIARMIAFARDARPADFALLAPEVVAAASEGDALGADLMCEGASYLVRAFAAVGLAAGEALCLTGGLGPAYADWLPEDLRSRLVTPLGSALDGALYLAGQEAP
jgi:glucosamine kinase